jgi:tetratricopeptide (TPR) repeat protein
VTISILPVVDPTDLGATLRQVGALMKQKEFEVAAKLVSWALYFNPNESILSRRMSEIALKRHDIPLALVSAQQAIKVNPSDVSNVLQLSLIYLEQRDFNEAEAAARHAMKVAPESGAPIRRLSEISRRRGKLEDALDWSNMAITVDPNDGTNYYQKAMILVAMKAGVAAIFALQRAVELAPNNVDFARRLEEVRASSP